MQAEETNTTPPATLTQPASEPLLSVLVPAGDTKDDDPDDIFLSAVAEIDTQPLLLKRSSVTIMDVLQLFFCSSLMLCGMVGIVWQAITYPHTLVILYTIEKPATITTTLDIPTRTLAPVTLTRSLTIPTTGTGHQDARAATGTLTFYNGNFSPQSIPIGTVFTGSDGVKIATSEAVTVPAAQPPQFAIASVAASAVSTGSNTNIAASDINLALSSDLLVKNLTSFTGGRDARDYRAVAQHDLNTLTAQLHQQLTQAMTQAFRSNPGEQAQPTNCHTTSTANHEAGDEAQTVTLNGRETCSAIAYNSQQLSRQATAAFTQTKPAANYHIAGSVQTTLQSVSPLIVTLSGKWVYTFSPDYEQLLAQRIGGDTPAKARKYLLSTGVISSASVPSVLPPAMYINFLVLVGEESRR